MQVKKNFMKRIVMVGLLFAVFTMVSSGTSIAATTVLGTCTVITPSASYTISSPGFYCLNASSNLSFATGRAITINANNVVLDLNGFTMTNTNGSNSAYGIGTTASPSNVTIRNGKIRGFDDGINFAAGAGIIIENMNIDALRTGIDVEAMNSIIRNNVTKSGSRGIIICEADVRILNNDIISNGGGIDSCDGSTVRAFVEGNRITNPTANGGNGIYLRNQGTLVVNNRFNNWSVGIVGTDTESMKYRDNLFIDVTTNVEGAGVIDAGNNN